MALVFEQQQKFNWKAAATVLAAIGAIGAATYFLFFSPVPAIENFRVPPAVKSNSELSNLKLDTTAVTNSQQFRSLRRYVGQPSVGEIGRENPFVKF